MVAGARTLPPGTTTVAPPTGLAAGEEYFGYVLEYSAPKSVIDGWRVSARPARPGVSGLWHFSIGSGGQLRFGNHAFPTGHSFLNFSERNGYAVPEGWFQD